MPETPRVFLSYRRTDSEFAVDRLFDELESRLGTGKVSRDLDRIQPGMNFKTVIREEIEKCDICIVVMGGQWIDARDQHGQRRLESDQDYVRTEIRAAKFRNIPIVPVLLGGTEMPPDSSLPADLRFLTSFHAATIRPARDFDRDVADLVKVLLATRQTKSLERPEEEFDYGDMISLEDGSALDDDFLTAGDGSDSGIVLDLFDERDSAVFAPEERPEKPAPQKPQRTALPAAASPPLTRKKRAGNQGLAIVAVFFILLTVILGVALYVVYEELQDLKRQQPSTPASAS